MTITTLSSREFNQGVSGVKKATKRGPVFVGVRHRPRPSGACAAEHR
jgi:hypothetical protein